MFFSRLFLTASIAAFCVPMPLASPARADVVTVGNTYSGGFNMLVAWSPGIFSVDRGVGGGNVGGSTGVIAGTTNSFQEFFCADLFKDATLNTAYPALYNRAGYIGGHVVNGAAQIAWLILNVAPALSTQAQNQGLQGLIWVLESPGQVEWDYAGNSAEATAAFTAYSRQLGSHTASTDSVWWINPTDGNGNYAYQGFVAATSAQVAASILDPGIGALPGNRAAQAAASIPEPGGFALFGTGAAALARLRSRREKRHGPCHSPSSAWNPPVVDSSLSM